MRFKMKMEGKKPISILKNGAKEYPKIVRKGAKDLMQEKLPIAQERAPEKTGTMKRTGRVTVTVRNNNVTAGIVFGSSDVLYAPKVHETHKTHSKFLESVINEMVSTAAADLVEKVNLRKIVK